MNNSETSSNYRNVLTIDNDDDDEESGRVCDRAPRYRYQRVLRWQTSVSCPAWKYTIVIVAYENNDIYGWYDGSVDQ